MKKLFVILLLIPVIGMSQTDKRLALVIGNTEYDGTSRLPNASNDAILIAKVLDSLDFETTLCLDVPDFIQMHEHFKTFFNLRDSIDPQVTFIYYSGHGAQLQDYNYLIPTKSNIKCIDEARLFAYPVNEIERELMQTSKGNANILVLDACRNNPYPSCKKSKSIGSDKLGLARITPTQGLLIAFSTDPGTVAWEGSGENSAYALSLSKYLLVEDMEIREVFRRVRNEVELIEDGQSPDMKDKLTGDLRLFKSQYEEEFISIDSLVKIGDDIHLSEAMELAGSILNSQPENLRALLVKGDIYIELKDYNKALKLYNKAIKLHPNDPKCFNYRGWLYLHKTKEYEKAIDDFDKCIEIDETYYYAYMNRGYTHQELEDYEKALSDYTMLIKLDKEDPQGYFYRASCYLAMGDTNSALIDYANAINGDDNNAYLLNNRGELLMNLEEYDLALEDFTNALMQEDISNYEKIKAMNGRANIFRSREDFKLAVDEYTLALSIEEHPVVYENRAYIYAYYLEDYEKALADYTMLIKLDKENPQGYFYRAKYYEYRGESNNAYLDFSRSIDLSPSNAYLLNNRGEFLMNLEEYDLALEDFTNALMQEDISNYEKMKAMNGRANIFRSREDFQLAVDEYTLALSIEEHPVVYKNRAYVYAYYLIDYEKALSDYTMFIKLDKENPQGYFYRASCYLSMGDTNSALIDYANAINGDDNNAELWNDRGELLMNLEEYDLALEDFTNALMQEDISNYEKMRAMNGRASVFRSREDFKLAVDEYTLALSIEEHPVLYDNRAYVYAYYLEDYEKALSDYTMFIKLDKENPEGYLNRAYIHKYMEDYNNALIDYTKAIDIASDVSVYLWYRAEFYSEFREYEKAKKDLISYLMLVPEDPDGYYALAEVLYDLGEYNESISKYQKCIKCLNNQIGELENEEVSSQLAQIYAEIAFVYTYLGEHEKAIENSNKSIEYHPDNFMQSISLSYAYLRNGDYSKVLDVCNDALKVDQGKSLLYMVMSFAYYRLGELDKSMESINLSIEIDDVPDMKNSYHDIKSQIFLLSKEYNKAIDECNTSISIAEHESTPYYTLGVIYDILNEPYMSINNFTIVIDLMLDGLDWPAKLDALITDYSGSEETYSLSDVYIRRAEVFKNEEQITLMCKDYKEACDLGDCEMFNTHCK